MAETQAQKDERDFIPQAAALARSARVATLATVDDGQPYASLVTPALLPDGAPLLLVSDLSAHTRHLRANPACSLLFVGQAAGENPQTAPRLTLIGAAARTDDPAARETFLKFHPYAEFYASFADFAYWRLNIAQAHYVGGFAAAARLDITALRNGIIGA